jgi:hypothetical protein
MVCIGWFGLLLVVFTTFDLKSYFKNYSIRFENVAQGIARRLAKPEAGGSNPSILTMSQKPREGQDGQVAEQRTRLIADQELSWVQVPPCL